MKKTSTPGKAEQTLRPPVIAIVGHIDHGKSTLLDFIRKTNIVAKEAGGITQHVGAYEVIHKTADGSEKKITFLDTPGHAAFSGIRERGVKVADVAILIVSGEEGVKTQTVEALKTIVNANVPYIVAITKMDKPAADAERTKQSLAENEIYVEGYGGTIPCVPISSKTGEGIPELLDMMLLVAEVEELTADASQPASGVIIEANRDTKKGITATLVIQNGTLESGKFIVAGGSLAPVRIMEDFSGKNIKAATFSSPVRIIGWSEIPQIGSSFVTVDSKKEAEVIAAENRLKKPAAEARKEESTTNTDSAGVVTTKPQINLILKADVSGSLEAIEGEMKKLKAEKVIVKIVQASVGSISENEIKVAVGVEGTIVVGFNVKIDSAADSLRERLGIEVKTFDIIYKFVEWLEELVAAKTPKQMVDEVTGRAKILKQFSRTKEKQVLGGKVETGTIVVGGEVKVLRRELEIARGRIKGLQQQKLKATQVEEGYEFGAEIECKMEIAPGDRIECFRTVEK